MTEKQKPKPYYKNVAISVEIHKRLKDHINSRFGKGAIGSYVEDLIRGHLENFPKQNFNSTTPPVR
jgi:hypothetical protein